MVIDYSNSFTLNEQTVYPVMQDGLAIGYVLDRRLDDVIQWEDLEAVTVYTKDLARGLVPKCLR